MIFTASVWAIFGLSTFTTLPSGAMIVFESSIHLAMLPTDSRMAGVLLAAGNCMMIEPA